MITRFLRSGSAIGCIQSDGRCVNTYILRPCMPAMRLSLPFVLPPLVAALLGGCAQAKHSPITPVESVDFPRFKGRWYVSGIIPTRFKRGSHNPVETYRLDSKSQIGTWYRYRPDSFDAPVKLLAFTDLLQPGTANAEWKVRFFGLFKTQHLIGWLAPDYRVVMVARDARDYLWCMARTPAVPAADYQVMLDLASALGYDASRIERVPQRWQETRQDKDTFHGECQ